MRAHIKEFVEICARTLPITEPIYEFGSLWPPSQGAFADLRYVFLDRKYVGVDMQSGAGVDLVCALPDTKIQDGCVGSLICVDTLEHVEYLRDSLSEFHRIMNDGAVIIVASVFSFPIHNYPQDFWRFTSEGLRSLLRDFISVNYGFIGPELSPSTVWAIGFKVKVPSYDQNNFLKEILSWKNKWEKS